MRAADTVVAIALILLGGVVIADAARLGIGWGTDGPKSGFFPFCLAVLMVAACTVILVQARRTRVSVSFVTRRQLDPVLKVLWPATAAVVLMQFVGLYVAAAVYLTFYTRMVGHHRWLVVIAIAVLTPVVTFFVFETWFLVPMPKGPLEAWLGY